MAVVLKAAPALQGIVLACWAAYTDDGLILCCVLTWRSSACRTLASCLTTFNPSVLNPPTDEDFADLPADVDLEEQRMLMAAIQGGGYEGHIPGEGLQVFPPGFCLQLDVLSRGSGAFRQLIPGRRLRGAHPRWGAWLFYRLICWPLLVGKLVNAKQGGGYEGHIPGGGWAQIDVLPPRCSGISGGHPGRRLRGAHPRWATESMLHSPSAVLASACKWLRYPKGPFSAGCGADVMHPHIVSLLTLLCPTCLAAPPPSDFAADPRYQPRVLSPGAQARQNLREEQVRAVI